MQPEKKDTDQEAALKRVRDQIDQIDQQIQTLISERARCAQRVAEIKTGFQAKDAVFYRPEREAQVLRKVMARNSGTVGAPEMARLFREIMSVCLALEQPMRVALIETGHHERSAAQKHFGFAAGLSVTESLETLFESLVSGEVDYAVVARPQTEDKYGSQLSSLLASQAISFVGEVNIDSGSETQELHLASHYVLSPAVEIGPSGRDKTAYLVDLEGTEPAVAEDALAKLNARGWLAFVAQNICLVVIAGHQSDDASVTRLTDLLGSDCQERIRLLGSFPEAVL